jgi:hypothetical protein
MASIEHRELSIGQKVWYRYNKFEAVNGPFKVKGFWQGHEGRHVVLSRGLGKPDHNVLLADDEDFGLLLFYDKQPEL